MSVSKCSSAAVVAGVETEDSTREVVDGMVRGGEMCVARNMW